MKIQINEPRYKGPALMLSAGFRPFFLLTVLYAVISVLAWAGIYAHGMTFPTAIAPTYWHGHEMVFGFAAGAVGGFLLTAVPNWTGKDPVHGAPLGLLVVLWLLGRVGFWMADLLPMELVALLDIGFLPALGFLVGQQIVGAQNKRNYMFLGLIGAFTLGNILFHAETLGLADSGRTGLYLGLYVVVGMVTVISGRIVPNFTVGALRVRGMMDMPDIRTEPHVEKGVIVSVVLAMVSDLVLDAGPITGLLALVATLFLVLRMRHWATGETLYSPILWVLHVGHGWLILGFAFKALADLTGLVETTTAMHALTAGAIGTMVMAVGSRAALGHTGRPLVVPNPMPLAYVLVSVGALIRVLGPAVLPFDYTVIVAASGIVWGAAYLIFGVLYLPILTRPRVDGRPG